MLFWPGGICGYTSCRQDLSVETLFHIPCRSSSISCIILLLLIVATTRTHSIIIVIIPATVVLITASGVSVIILILLSSTISSTGVRVIGIAPLFSSLSVVFLVATLIVVSAIVLCIELTSALVPWLVYFVALVVKTSSI